MKRRFEKLQATVVGLAESIGEEMPLLEVGCLVWGTADSNSQLQQHVSEMVIELSAQYGSKCLHSLDFLRCSFFKSWHG